MYDKFIGLNLDEDEFVVELKNGNFGLSPNEIANMYSLVTKEDTNQVNRDLLLKRPKFIQQMELLEMFCKFDQDGDKCLSKSEFESALTQMGFDEHDIDTVFEKFDTDNDQTISLQEFIQVCEVAISYINVIYIY